MNPFRPTAGKMPPILIGREADIADFYDGLTGGAGAPGRLMLVTGQRGFGKTVLLTEFQRVARAEGWPVVSEVASEGLCTRVVDSLRRQTIRVTGAELNPTLGVADVVNLSLGSLSVEAQMAATTLRGALEDALARAPEGKGVLISVDEVQAAPREEMVALATAVQLVTAAQDLTDLHDSQKRGVALVLAGLPSVVDDLEDDKTLTFLRRAQRHDLAEVGVPDVRNAYVQTVEESGMSVSDAVAMTAAEATMGFPYLVQLVGHYMWQSAGRRHSAAIEAEDVERAIPDAERAFQDAVCAPAFRALTDAQQLFVASMLPDLPGPSAMADVLERSARSEAWGWKYRRSLLDAHVVRPAGAGSVAFDIPFFGNYLCRTLGYGIGEVCA